MCVTYVPSTCVQCLHFFITPLLTYTRGRLTRMPGGCSNRMWGAHQSTGVWVSRCWCLKVLGMSIYLVCFPYHTTTFPNINPSLSISHTSGYFKNWRQWLAGVTYVLRGGQRSEEWVMVTWLACLKWEVSSYKWTYSGPLWQFRGRYCEPWICPFYRWENWGIKKGVVWAIRGS